MFTKELQKSQARFLKGDKMSEFIYEFVMRIKEGWFWPLSIILIVTGFIMLVNGADIFVTSASRLAKYIKIPAIVVGLTLVAFGTSAPELSVSVAAAISGSSGISVGNIVGSNIFNLLLVLGISAVLKPFSIDKEVAHRDIPVMLFSSFLLLAASLLFGINGSKSLLWFEGLVMVVLFVLYVVYMVRYEVKHTPIEVKNQMKENANEKISLPLTILLLIASLAIIVVGGNFVNAGAKAFAVKIGVSETLAGLTICAVGTSLPELVTSVIAIRKNENDIAIGNVVGSNLFNVMLILGVCSVITPLGIDLFSLIDIAIMVVIFIAFFIYTMLSSKVDRKAGIVMIALYVAFLTFIVLRENGYIPNY